MKFKYVNGTYHSPQLFVKIKSYINNGSQQYAKIECREKAVSYKPLVKTTDKQNDFNATKNNT